MVGRKDKKAQSIVEYTLIAAVVIGAVILIASSLKSKLEGEYKDKVESTVTNTVNSMNKGVFASGGTQQQ